MIKVSRTERIVKNSFWGIVSRTVSLILSFVSRTVFINVLGKEFLGINGVYTEVLQVLSLAQLGFGTALNFALYKPVADNDREKTIKLLDFYKTVYRIIAVVVATLGLLLLPFLPKILNGAEHISAFNLRLYFLIFLANTVIGYFVSYKFSYINALQKNYIVTKIELVTNTVIVVLQILAILVTKSFLVYLLIHTGLLALSRVAIFIYLGKKYPFLNQKVGDKLTKEEKKPIFREVKGLMVHQFSSVAVHSTDNIIISSLTGLGVVMVGLISNYNMLINAVLGFVTLIFSSTTSSFGNLVASSTSANYRKAFLDMNFLNFWVYGFCSIAFFILIPPFIELWLGKDFLIDNVSFLLIVFNCFLVGQATIYNNARVGKGDFNRDKWLSFSQAIVNLVVSIIAAKYLGLLGVYIGTIVSRLVVVVFRPILTYKFLFEKSSYEYYVTFVGYLVVILISGAITYMATYLLLREVTVLKFALSALIVAILPNLLFFVFTFWTNGFKSFFCRLKAFIPSRKVGVKND